MTKIEIGLNVKNKETGDVFKIIEEDLMGIYTLEAAEKNKESIQHLDFQIMRFFTDEEGGVLTDENGYTVPEEKKEDPAPEHKKFVETLNKKEMEELCDKFDEINKLSNHRVNYWAIDQHNGTYEVTYFASEKSLELLSRNTK